MSYLDVAAIAQNRSIIDRVTACAWVENVTGEPSTTRQWVIDKAGAFASQPGWADAWETAKTADRESVDDPAAAPVRDYGADPDVITDQMILTAVRAVGEIGGTE